MKPAKQTEIPFELQVVEGGMSKEERRREYQKKYYNENKQVLTEKNKEYRKIWYQNNPEKRKAHQKKWCVSNKYRITIDEYREMFVRQDNKCAICGREGEVIKGSQSLHVDHCHSTKKVRGLLCRDCNLGIGRMKDDVENLKKAILYLQESK